jgi:hypothetical protein
MYLVQFIFAMTNKLWGVIALAGLLTLVTCKKEDDDYSLSGSTNLELTKVDSVSTVYVKVNGQNAISADIKIKSNIDGVVTYTGSADLKTASSELQAKALQVFGEHGDYYVDTNLVSITPDLIAHFEFKLKITSEGYLDYGMEGKPWVMVRYADPVGTTYSITNKNNEMLTRTITEKTGLDDWPYGFLLIKTTEVEQPAPSDDPLVDHLTYRVNHKFGLVYLEYVFKDGTDIRIDVFPWFLL